MNLSWSLTVSREMPKTVTPAFLELLEGVAEAAGLDGAAGCIGAGVEEEDYGGFRVVGEGDGLAVLVLEGKVLDEIAWFHESFPWGAG